MWYNREMMNFREPFQEPFNPNALRAVIDRHAELREKHVLLALGPAVVYEAELDKEVEDNLLSTLEEAELARYIAQTDASDDAHCDPTARELVDLQRIYFDARVSELVGGIGGYMLDHLSTEDGESELSLHSREDSAAISLVFKATEDDFLIDKKKYMLRGDLESKIIGPAKSIDMPLESSDTALLTNVARRLHTVQAEHLSAD
jgi:hypothetical protein